MYVHQLGTLELHHRLSMLCILEGKPSMTSTNIMHKLHVVVSVHRPAMTLPSTASAAHMCVCVHVTPNTLQPFPGLLFLVLEISVLNIGHSLSLHK